MKETAVFYRSWFEAAAGLPAADFKELFLSLADCAFNGGEAEEFSLLGADLSPVARAIFTLARPAIKKNCERWEARVAEAGRPPLDVTAEDARKAVRIAGSVKGAAELLGVSVRTMHRRLSVPKCQNAKNVNVNVNVNDNVCHTREKFSDLSAARGARQPPADTVKPLATADPTPMAERDKIATSLATFKERLKQGKLERFERAEKTGQKNGKEAKKEFTAHNGYYAHFFFADDAS